MSRIIAIVKFRFQSQKKFTESGIFYREIPSIGKNYLKELNYNCCETRRKSANFFVAQKRKIIVLLNFRSRIKLKKLNWNPLHWKWQLQILRSSYLIFKYFVVFDYCLTLSITINRFIYVWYSSKIFWVIFLTRISWCLRYNRIRIRPVFAKI